MTSAPGRFSPAAFRLVICVLVAQAVYASLLIYRSSALLPDQRWFALLDDPMISMRYARNLADGLGLVWNAGERVEGITNPGWAFIMALVHLVEDNRGYTSLYMQIISTFCIIATSWLTARIAWRVGAGDTLLTVAATVVTAFYFPLLYWAVFGMETGLLGLLITAAVAVWLREQEARRFPWQSYLILGVATIVRIDAAVPLLVLGGYSIITADTNNRRMHHGAATVMVLGTFVGGQTLARLLYYGYPFPNTYYLKMTGFPLLNRIARGAYVTSITLWTLLLPLITVAIAACIASMVRRGQHKTQLLSKVRYREVWSKLLRHPTALLVFLFSGQTAYSVYVGGDAWEDTVFCNRYIIVVFPLFAIFTSQALLEMSVVMVRKFSLKPAFATGTAFVILLLGFIYQNWNSVYPYYRSGMMLDTNHRLPAESKRLIQISKEIQSLASADWVVSSDWAGAIPYYIDNYAVDPLGKCDVHIAHQPARRKHSPVWYKEFYPGHMKWDAEYTYETYKPDLMVFLWVTGSGRDFNPITLRYYDRISLDGLRGVFFKHTKHTNVTM